MIIFVLLINFATLAVINGKLVDRSTRDINEIPDGKKNTADFCEKWGYKAEEHTITTSDGYILTIFRVPFGMTNKNQTNRIPVLIQHGIYLNSDSWVFRGPQDLPFLLADEGYDVWISNTRGTPYSKHRRYSRRSFKFWNYSPDEASLIDLKAFIDYILNVTKKPSLSYIGHSRGGAMPIMLLSSLKEYNQKVHLLQLMAPVIYSANITSPLYMVAGSKPHHLMDLSSFKFMIQSAHMTTILFMPSPVKSAIKNICSTGTVIDRVCPLFYFFVNGGGSANFDYSLTSLLLDHFSDGIASKELLHLLQIADSDKFQKFDYGKGNMARYGQNSPPLYNISKVTAPVYIYYGPNDLFISERDLKKFIRELPNFRSAYKIPYKDFSHVDYFWGMNTNEVFFPRFIEDLNKFSKTISKEK